STSTRSRNSLFSNNFNNTNNYFTNPAPTYSTASSTCSIPPITVTTSNGLSHFNVSWTATRPRTSSDLQQSQQRYFHPSNASVSNQISPDNLKLGRDLTSIHELSTEQDIMCPISRPRAATIGSTLLVGKQRISAVLSHIKMNWSKNKSTLGQIKSSLTSKHFTSENTTTNNISSSINMNCETMAGGKHSETEDEYVETCEMNMDAFPAALAAITGGEDERLRLWPIFS
ncbi:unnamed protein product, partial [Trichobilharzia regenti]